MKLLPFKVLEDGTIDLNPSQPPFNGEAVLIQTHSGITEATWDEYPGGAWLWSCHCCGQTLELEDAVGWCPLPEVLPLPRN